MLRFALGPDGSVVPDVRRKLPGRGVWTTLSFEAVSRAAAKQAFSRAFRAKAAAAASLAETVDALLERDALQSLSIANKAGLVVAGASKQNRRSRLGGVAALVRRATGRPTERPSGSTRCAPNWPGSRRCRARRYSSRRANWIWRSDRQVSYMLPLNVGGEFGLSRKGGSCAVIVKQSGRGAGTARGRDAADKAGTMADPAKLAEKPSG